mgnify:CR=1 FL=1
MKKWVTVGLCEKGVILELGYVAILLWPLMVGICYANSRDIASPTLMVGASAGVYYSDLLISDYIIEIHIAYWCILFTLILASFAYRKRITRYFPNSLHSVEQHKPFHTGNIKRDYTTILFWVASLPAVLSQIYMIQMFDGFAGYVFAAKRGTEFFHGLGPLKSIIASYYPISFFYFALVIRPGSSKAQRYLYLVHFLIFILMAVLTLSRGTLLTQFVSMGLIFHFAHKKLKPVFIVLSLSLLLAVASIYGVLRETVVYADGSFELNYGNRCDNCDKTLGKEYYKSEWTYAALFAYKRVVEADTIDKQLGLTYATILTNLIPRKIWPDKPAPGGVIFTNEYAPGIYDEYSHFATGLMAEAIMNFGLFGGTLIGYLQLFAALLVMSKIHSKYFLNKQGEFLTIRQTKNLVLYVYASYAIGNLLIAEITSLMVGLLIKFIVILLMYKLLQLKVIATQKSRRGVAVSVEN